MQTWPVAFSVMIVWGNKEPLQLKVGTYSAQ